jgi:hypothetical protein
MKPHTSRVLTLPPVIFRRTLGVHLETYQLMKGVLEQRHQKKRKSGRPAALDLDDQLVLTLSFLREYRTHHHLALEWGVEETTVRRTIERVENALVKSQAFKLPGRKALRDQIEFEVVVVDVTETPAERPKKSNEPGTAANTKSTPSKPK